jgi:glutamate racemase
MVDCNIDHLVLGCTHYPFLKPVLERMLPEHITIVDPAPAVALQTKRVAENHGLLCNKAFIHSINIEFYSSSNTNTLKNLVGSSLKLNDKIEDVYFANIKL